jgi:hypothetical protein
MKNKSSPCHLYVLSVYALSVYALTLRELKACSLMGEQVSLYQSHSALLDLWRSLFI